jgi:hypothetical protein
MKPLLVTLAVAVMCAPSLSADKPAPTSQPDLALENAMLRAPISQLEMTVELLRKKAYPLYRVSYAGLALDHAFPSESYISPTEGIGPLRNAYLFEPLPVLTLPPSVTDDVPALKNATGFDLIDNRPCK